MSGDDLNRTTITCSKPVARQGVAGHLTCPVLPSSRENEMIRGNSELTPGVDERDRGHAWLALLPLHGVKKSEYGFILRLAVDGLDENGVSWTDRRQW